MLAARARAGFTQEAVVESRGTTKSAACRLEAGGKPAPSLTTLKKYAHAVGCRLEIRLAPDAAVTNDWTSGVVGRLHALPTPA